MISIPNDIANIIGRYCKPNIFYVQFNTRNSWGCFRYPEILTTKYFIADCEYIIAEWLYNHRNDNGPYDWIKDCIYYCTDKLSFYSPHIKEDKMSFVRLISQKIKRLPDNTDVFVIN